MLCSDELVDPKSIEGLVACQLILLDKSPGITPIAVDEVLRGIAIKVGYIKRYLLPTIMRRFSIRMRSSSSCSSGSF